MFQQLRSTAYRKRSKVFPPYPKKETLRTFQIPDMFRLNSSDEPFLIHDSANPDRLIVFASKTSLKYLGKYLNVFIDTELVERCFVYETLRCLFWFFLHLETCTMIHSDGTFKTAPRYFSQAYTIHGWSSSTGTLEREYIANNFKRMAVASWISFRFLSSMVVCLVI